MSNVSTAYVLAAGLGTRLRPLTDERPKPLVEVCGTPLVHFALSLLADAGVKRVGINSHWLHPQLPNALGTRFGDLEIHTLHEPDILGTGGGLQGLVQLVPPPPGERVLVLNADALIDLGARALTTMPDDLLATLVLTSSHELQKYGAIGTDDSDRIVTFAGRIKPLGRVVRERMFCGVHVVHPRAFSILPPVTVENGVARGTMSGINDEGYPRWLEKGESLRAFDSPGMFCDVGTPERLWEANLAILSGAWKSTHLEPFARFLTQRPGVYVSARARVAVDARITAPALIDDGAVVESGADVSFSVVGKDCHVGGHTRLERSVLQSGARVNGLVTDAIVSPRSRLQISPEVSAQIRGEWSAGNEIR